MYPENAPRNRVLACLSEADFGAIEPHLEHVSLTFRQRLQSPNRAIENVYFPLSGLSSVVASGRGHEAQSEVALIGYEGMTGLPVIQGTDRSPYEIFMQVEGDGKRISSQLLRRAMSQSSTMRECFLLYAHTFAIQNGYTALANARGTIEQRLARWLLMAQDRLGCPALVLTHDFLSLVLGVRRAGVTAMLREFQSKALTRSERRVVTILNRDGLEELANGLYGPPEAEYERLFPTFRDR